MESDTLFAAKQRDRDNRKVGIIRDKCGEDRCIGFRTARCGEIGRKDIPLRIARDNERIALLERAA